MTSSRRRTSSPSTASRVTHSARVNDAPSFRGLLDLYNRTPENRWLRLERKRTANTLHVEAHGYRPPGDPTSRAVFSLLMELAESLIQQIQSREPCQVDLSASDYTLHPPACGDFLQTRLSRSRSLVFFNIAPYGKRAAGASRRAKDAVESPGYFQVRGGSLKVTRRYVREEARGRFPAGPYCGRAAVLTTKHGKERTVSRPFRAALGLVVKGSVEVDTDQLGTFTGEVERVGTPQEVAIGKARLGMRASGIPLGLASEGSFGPHPPIPFLIAWGRPVGTLAIGKAGASTPRSRRS